MNFSPVDDQFRQTLSRVISETRGESSQREFAEKLNVSQSTVHSWELGKNVPDLENLIKLAQLRGQLPEELIAELFGRRCGDERPWEERVKLLTSEQLISLLGLVADRLRGN